MKFKTILVSFNIIIIGSLGFILLMPLLMLRGDYVKVFWRANWYLPAVFALMLSALNFYFLKNRKVFSFFENEDWAGARAYLEDRIYSKNRYSRQAIRLLINTYIVMADTGALEKLSRYLEESSPRYFPVFALELGIPYTVGGNADAMRDYFERALKRSSVHKRPWLIWHSAFAGLGSSSAETRGLAAASLRELAVGGRDGVLRLFAASLLDSRGGTGDDEFTRRMRAELKALHTRGGWEKLFARFGASLVGLVLKRFLAEAEKWLYEGEEND